MGPYLILLPFLVVTVTSSPFSSGSTIAGLSNELGVSIHKKLSTGDDNVFFSPVSISTALGMLFYGTRGKTAEEMRRALKYKEAGLADSDVHSAFKNLMESFGEDSAAKEYILYLANAVLSQKDYPILAEYKDGLQKNYKAEARDVDFQNEGEKAVQEINDWVKLKTNGQIDKLLDEVDPSTIMVLLNAVYFKGTWKTEFDPDHTYAGLFFNKGLQNEPAGVPMMHLTENLPYIRFGGARALELPYKGEDLSMVIILPDALNGLSDVEAEMTPSRIMDVVKNTHKTEIHVSMPKFKLEYEKTLNDVLRELGIKNVFENNADLSGISKGGPTAVSKVVHKAVVEVNEEGSEASAVTGVVIETRMGGLDNEFVVNHPFFFAIVDKRNSMVLFQGRVNQL